MSALIPFGRKFPRISNNDFYDFMDDFFLEPFSGKNIISNISFKLDVQEKDTEYLVEAEIPGIKKEEVDVDFHDGRLTISINRQEEKSEDEKNYIHKERRSSSMQRSIYLKYGTIDNIKAKLDNGILIISVPKKEKIDNNKKIIIE